MINFSSPYPCYNNYSRSVANANGSQRVKFSTLGKTLVGDNRGTFRVVATPKCPRLQGDIRDPARDTEAANLCSGKGGWHTEGHSERRRNKAEKCRARKIWARDKEMAEAPPGYRTTATVFTVSRARAMSKGV